VILIDSNALVLLIVGFIDPRIIAKHKRTSIFVEKDFDDLVEFIGDFSRLIVLPNIWTEVDNLLNSFSGDRKEKYVVLLKELVSQTTEKYINSALAVNSDYFMALGLTDVLVLELGQRCNCLITADLELSDLASANSVKVYDLKRKVNDRLNN